MIGIYKKTNLNCKLKNYQQMNKQVLENMILVLKKKIYNKMLVLKVKLKENYLNLWIKILQYKKIYNSIIQ